MGGKTHIGVCAKLPAESTLHGLLPCALNTHYDIYTMGKGDYTATISGAPFLYSEMRITAAMLLQSDNVEKVRTQIRKENLYQYPSNQTINKISSCCCARIIGMGAPHLAELLAEGSASVAKQICLYAMMKQSRLLCEFMVSIIGEKFRTLDYYLSRRDINDFFSLLAEQNESIAVWTPATVIKIKRVIRRLLTDCDYLDAQNATQLLPVYLSSALQETIINQGESFILPAFNIFS